MTRWVRAIAALLGVGLAGALALVGALSSPTAATSSSRGPVVFHVALLQAPDSLNPYTGIMAESYEMWYLMYPTLTTPAQTDLHSTPALARSWSRSPDGLRWTFHLRHGVTWTDGKPLTSDDVVYSLGSIVDGGVQRSTWGSYLKQVAKVTAPDRYTVVLHLSKPNVTLPYLPMPIVPKHVWGNLSDSQVRSFKNSPPDIVGAGPFRLVSADSTLSTLTFVRNPSFWGPRPSIDKVVFVAYKVEDAAVQALQKGEVDFVEGISGRTVQNLQGAAGITTHVGVAPGFDEIAFNTGSVDLETGDPMGNPNPAVLDPKFRHALGYAVDKQEIVDKVYQGLGTPAESVLPRGFPYSWQPPAKIAYRFSLKKAGELLDQAGYPIGSDGKRHMPDGSPIGTLRLYARSESQTSIGTLTYFHEWLGDLGISSQVTTMSGDRLTGIILDGNYDIFQWGWILDPDPDSVMSYFTCAQRGAWSDSWYCNKRYDRLYNAQHVELDSKKRATMLDTMQRMLYLQAPYIVTSYGATGEAYRSDRFTGFSTQPSPNGVYLIQYGPYNYIHAKPVSGSSDASAQLESRNRTAFAYLLGGALVVVLAGSYTTSRLRARTADDRP